jgi:IS605 OrfB family transposase
VILSCQSINALINGGAISANNRVWPSQIQPASLDLRLAGPTWRVRASFLPGAGTVREKLAGLAIGEVNILDGAILETGCVYVAQLQEYLLGSDATVIANHLDDLLSRLDPNRKDSVTAKRRYSMRRAAQRLRARIRDLVDELHWKTCRFLVTNFDVIILPTFETSDMVLKCKRKIRRKSVRSLLTFSHFRFKQRLKNKASEFGKVVIDADEAYTSKTASWTGEIKQIGGAKFITSNGIRVERDINGARGIFLRALVDHPGILNDILAKVSKC